MSDLQKGVAWMCLFVVCAWCAVYLCIQADRASDDLYKAREARCEARGGIYVRELCLDPKALR